jgi:TatD DNase family protein
MPLAWIDTHAHLTNEELLRDLPGVLARAARAEVTSIVCVGIDRESSERAVAIAAEQHGQDLPRIWASVGIHPNHAHLTRPGDWERILELATDSGVCALGETGLDQYWDDCPLEIQKVNFAEHWSASRALGLPVIVHTRDCDTAMMDALAAAGATGPLSGILHSFAGSWELAQLALDLGMHISFSGILTYKKSQALREIAARIPIDRLLLETDAPYLSPEPVRSERPNEPHCVVHTARVLAEVRHLTLDSLSRQTTHNARSLFARMR